MNILTQIALNVNRPENPFTKAMRYVAEAIGQDELRILAAQCGFVERLRNFDPAILVATYIDCTNNAKTFSIDYLHTCYNAAAAKSGYTAISKTSFEKQLNKPAFKDFCRAVMEHVINRTGHLPLSASGDLAKSLMQRVHVNRVLITDGTELKMVDTAGQREEQAERCKGKAGTCGIKVHYTYDPLSGTFACATVGSAVSSETAEVPTEMIKDCLWLADAGYVSFDLFQKLQDNGARYLVRAKQNANPMVNGVRIYSTDFKLKETITESKPMKMNEFMAKHNLVGNDIFDFDVLLRPGLKSRFIKYFDPVKAIRRDGEDDFAYFYCNVSHELLNVEAIRIGYHLRWAIECLGNKCTKQFNGLIETKIKKVDTEEAFVYLSTTAHTLKSGVGQYLQQVLGQTLSSMKIQQRAGIFLKEIVDVMYYMFNSYYTLFGEDLSMNLCKMVTKRLKTLSDVFLGIAKKTKLSKISCFNKVRGKSFKVQLENFLSYLQTCCS